MPVEKICMICKTRFTCTPSKALKVKTCSRECANKLKREYIARHCIVCHRRGMVHRIMHSEPFICSKDCLIEYEETNTKTTQIYYAITFKGFRVGMSSVLMELKDGKSEKEIAEEIKQQLYANILDMVPRKLN